MEEEGPDAWTRRLSTRAQIEYIERGGPPSVTPNFCKKWLPDGKPIEDRDAARKWLDKFATKSGPVVYFSFDDQDEDYPVRAGNVEFFADLDYLAETFVELQQWTMPSARAWLITKDARPIVPAVELELSRPPDPESPELDKLNYLYVYHPKVTLEVTLDTPPKVVMDYYEKAQRLYEEESGKDLKRGREMADWTLDLVAFAVSRNDGRAWPQLLAAWNASTPEDWHFKSSKQINLATRKGYRTLMGEDLDWRGPSIRPARPKNGGDE